VFVVLLVYFVDIIVLVGVLVVMLFVEVVGWLLVILRVWLFNL
jgi:hypothetical protein